MKSTLEKMDIISGVASTKNEGNLLDVRKNRIKPWQIYFSRAVGWAYNRKWLADFLPAMLHKIPYV